MRARRKGSRDQRVRISCRHGWSQGSNSICLPSARRSRRAGRNQRAVHRGIRSLVLRREFASALTRNRIATKGKNMATPTGAARPSPTLVYQTLNAYQNTAALRAAIDLDIFTAIGEGVDTSAALATRCKAAERGVRILCDYLTILGFLTKQDHRYALTPDSAKFLDRRSPDCVASTAGFLTLPGVVTAFMSLADAIRAGRPALEGDGSISPENPSPGRIRAVHGADDAAHRGRNGAGSRCAARVANGKFWILPPDTAYLALRSRSTIRKRKFSPRIGRPCWRSPWKTHAQRASKRACIACRAAPSTSNSAPVTTSRC